MAGISSPGLGSGLDVNGLVTKLMAVEQQPLTALAATPSGCPGVSIARFPSTTSASTLSSEPRIRPPAA